MAYEHEVFPWLKHLGEDGQREFFEEIQQISVLSKELGKPLSDYVTEINICVASWKATAEAWADPELRRILTSDCGFNEEDFVEAERPEDPGCCLERSVCDHAAPTPPLPQRRVKAPRKLCSSNCPNSYSAQWCALADGHVGPHRSRDGHTWTDEDARQMEISDQTTALEALKNFPGPRDGE